MRELKRLIAAAFLLGWVTQAVMAHVAPLTSATAVVGGDGRVRVTVNLDVISFALGGESARVADGEMDRLLDGGDEALAAALAAGGERLKGGTRFEPGGKVEGFHFATVGEVRGYLAGKPVPRLPVVMGATFDVVMQGDARTFSVRFPEVLGTVVLTVERPGEEPAAVAANPGEVSEAVAIHLTGSAWAATEPAASHVSFGRTLVEFVGLGFRHILPEGLDHILFVLGLFLLSSKVKPLLWQVTAFTVAHSMTLALSLYGVVRLPSGVVEPLIAASIAFVAIENLFTAKLNPWRPAVVFGFGLVHGLGFSAALTDLHLARSSFLPALVGFNFGVEMGQLAVIAGAFLVVGWFRAARWYRPVVAVPASVVIAGMGLFWMVQRVVWP